MLLRITVAGILFLAGAGFLQAQTATIVFKVADNSTRFFLAGATISVNKKTAVADSAGVALFKAIKGEKLAVAISFTGYTAWQVDLLAADTTINAELQINEADDGEKVIVTSARNNSRIEDLATRVEVLGREEMEEENGIKPGNISSILGDFSGIQIQQTNAATNNADMRVQGLPGKYTQILRDGLPLYGGFGSSFNLLQIPPLDLQQIELIKGSASTLYGGGAIAGMVNLVSKKPQLHRPEHAITLNQTTLLESNVNLFSASRNEKTGYTFFAAGNYQKAMDVNKDGFSDVASVKSLNIHPRIFFYTSNGSSIILGYSVIFENRNGGDMQVLHNQKNSQHQFFIQNKSLRNTVDGIWERKLSGTANIVTKASVSFYNRQIHTNVFGMHALQTAAYAELSYNNRWKQHNFVAGFNYTGDYFALKQPDSSYLTNQDNFTFGAFVQDDWQLNRNLTLQAGIRADGYHYSYGRKPYVLPKLSVKYTFNPQLTARMGGGYGYKNPGVFNAEVDERDYRYLRNVGKDVRAETSAGINADVNYKTKLAGWQLNINQAFYYTVIQHPLLYDSSSFSLQLYNETRPLKTAGTETWVRFKKGRWETYFGYTYTNTQRKYNREHPNFPLTARHKFAALVSAEMGDHFRTGIESSFVGRQFLHNGSRRPSYTMVAFMLRYSTGKLVFVLNGENLPDYRQSKKEPVVFPPWQNPSFPELWAPLDGRVINFSVQVKW